MANAADAVTYLDDVVEVGQFPTIPANTYDATLEGVSQETHAEYGLRWVWHWTIPEMHPDGGDFELRVWTPPRISSTGIAREMAQAVGADTSKAAKVDLGSLRGRSARLAVVLDDKGERNKVKAAMPASADAPNAKAATADPEYAAWLAAKQAAEREQHAQDGRPASEAERAALDDDAPLPEPSGEDAAS